MFIHDGFYKKALTTINEWETQLVSKIEQLSIVQLEPLSYQMELSDAKLSIHHASIKKIYKIYR